MTILESGGKSSALPGLDSVSSVSLARGVRGRQGARATAENHPQKQRNRSQDTKTSPGQRISEGCVEKHWLGAPATWQRGKEETRHASRGGGTSGFSSLPGGGEVGRPQLPIFLSEHRATCPIQEVTEPSRSHFLFIHPAGNCGAPAVCQAGSAPRRERGTELPAWRFQPGQSEQRRGESETGLSHVGVQEPEGALQGPSEEGGSWTLTALCRHCSGPLQSLRLGVSIFAS